MKTLFIAAALAACTVAHANLDDDYQAWAQSMPTDIRVGFVNSKVCVMLADIALTVGKLRDAGQPRAAVMRGTNSMQQHIARQGAVMVVDYAYNNPELSPMDVFVDVGMACKKVF